MAQEDDPAVLINQFIAAAASDGETELYAKELAGLLADKSISLLLFIQALGPSLTSNSTVTRTHSTNCLAATLLASDDGAAFSMQDIAVLLQFLLTKLDDEKLTLHVFNALASLVKYKNFRPNVNGNLLQLLQSISDLYEPRKHLAKVRYESFHLLDALFRHHVDDLIAVPVNAEKFISTFLHIASGEKDPRNLLMSFRLNTAINERLAFDLRTTNEKHDQLLTDLFDVAFCYFPISFTPPANDPYKISSQDLKLELRKTIASQSQFAQDTFPSLFEKLTSTNPAVRNDVLQCLCLCIESYSSEVLEQFWVTIWDALKFEILHNDASIFKPEADYLIPPEADSLDDTDEKKIVIYTLIVLTKLVKKLEDAESFDSVKSSIIADLGPHCTSLDDKMTRQAVILLCATGISSLKLYDEIVKFLFSFGVWGRFVRSDMQHTDSTKETEVDISLTVTRQRELIDYLGFVLAASSFVGGPNELWGLKDHLLVFMGQALQHSSNLEKTLKCKVTQQLTKMSLMNCFLSKEEVGLTLTWLGDNIAGIINNASNPDWQSDLLLQEIVRSFMRLMTEGEEDILRSNVSSVIETVLPMLLDRISEDGVLNLINRLCVNYHFLEVLSIRLLNKLAFEEFETDVFGNIIECLTKSFVQTQQIKPFLTNTWQQSFIPRFLGIVLKKAGDDPVILELSGQLFGFIIRFIEKSKHQSLLNEFIPIFLGEREAREYPFKTMTEAPSSQIALFKHLIAKIDKSVVFPGYSQIPLVQKLVSIAKSLEMGYVRLGYLQVIALLINKFVPGENEVVKSLFTESFESGSSDAASLELAIWILKGLVVRLDSSGFYFMDRVVSELTESDNLRYCKAISNSFVVLMSDMDIFMNKENSKSRIISGVVNLNSRLLYKQQIFEKLLQKLLTSFATTKTASQREVNLLALAIIINNVSSEILKPHLKEVLPLVLNGLTVQNSSVLEASLQTFKVIIEESPELIQENLSSLLNKLTFLSVHKIVLNKKLINNETIRLLSLDCILGIFTNMEAPKLVKYQHGTRTELSRGLDDKRRDVRKKTTDVRQALFELGR